jgi:hypothetical protein
MLKRKQLVAACGALALFATLSTQALAQPFPSTSPDYYAHDPVVQVMLAGEANAVASYLGISVGQLQAELTGHSLADVTRQHGKSTSEVTNLMVQTANQQLDAAVASGAVPADAAAGYRLQLMFFAPTLVNSADASAFALQIAAAA